MNAPGLSEQIFDPEWHAQLRAACVIAWRIVVLVAIFAGGVAIFGRTAGETTGDMIAMWFKAVCGAACCLIAFGVILETIFAVVIFLFCGW
jgi:hypothetical protein